MVKIFLDDCLKVKVTVGTKGVDIIRTLEREYVPPTVREFKERMKGRTLFKTPIYNQIEIRDLVMITTIPVQ